MRTDEIRTFSTLGRALWAQPSDSERVLVEIFTAAGLLDVSDDRRLERAAAQLLERALQEGNAANALSNIAVLNQPFFRLDPRERFILVALHQGQWSYARLARVLSKEPAQIEQIAWNARLKLGAHSGKYPTGTSILAASSCPEYDLKAPWTQRFFDDEMKQQERLYVQNHVMACASCRDTVGRCREIYYSVEALLPSSGADQSLVEKLEGILGSARIFFSGGSRTAGETFSVFLSRRDVQLALGVFLALVAMLAFKALDY